MKRGVIFQLIVMSCIEKEKNGELDTLFLQEINSGIPVVSIFMKLMSVYDVLHRRS